MELKLERFAKKSDYTVGRLFIDGEYFSNTLEDTDRGLRKDMTVADIKRIKVPGKTAIPAGRYQVTLNIVSPRFSTKKQYAFCGGRLPRLLDVPGYQGVLVHVGNSHTDTEGCILVGENRAVGKVLNSTATFRKLYERLEQAHKAGEDIYITIA